MGFNKQFSKQAKAEYAEKKKREYEQLQTKMLDKIKNTTSDPTKTLKLVSFLNRFHQYSPHNRQLIFSQRDGALAVGSFKYFKDEGYSIKKGEKGIKVLVPEKATLFERTENGKSTIQSLKTATALEKRQIKEGKIKTFTRTSFRLGTVFDVTQTNMPKEKYPEYYPNRHQDYQIKNETKAKEIQQTLGQVAKDFNIELGKSKLTQNAHGMYAPQLNAIMLNPDNTPTEDVSVTIHELAHAALHSTKETEFAKNFGINPKDFKDQPTAIKELQAELVAYSISSQFGIDTSKSSERYIASWTKNGKKLNELEPNVQKKILDGIAKVTQGFDNEIMSSIKKKEKQQTRAKDRTRSLDKIKPKEKIKEKTRNVGRSL